MPMLTLDWIDTSAGSDPAEHQAKLAVAEAEVAGFRTVGVRSLFAAWEQAELELLTQAEWTPPVVADEPEPEAEGSDVSVSSAGASEGQVLMLKLEGVLAEQMRDLAEAQGVAGNVRGATNDLDTLRGEVDATVRKVEQLVDEVNRKWPFQRDTELKLK